MALRFLHPSRPTQHGAVPLPWPGPPRVASRLGWLVLVFMMVGYGCLFGWLSLELYWGYQMHALDMGNMGQAAWNTVHGHPFFFTNMRLPYAIEAWRTTTRLSFHVEFLFPAISLLYLVAPRPESLLVLQTLALATGAIPVYLLARSVLRSIPLALSFVLAYLLSPSLEALNLYEFHPVALATPLLLWAFYFLWTRRYVLYLICSFAAMGTKEQIGLIVVMFGLCAVGTGRDRRVGITSAAIGLTWSLLAAGVIEHHFRQPGTVTYLRTRYGYLGHGVSGILHTLTHDPGTIPAHVFIWPKLTYLERLLAPVGYLPLLSPIAMLLGAPTLVLNLLSSDFHMYSGIGDNSAELISVMMIAGILGAEYLVRVLRRFTTARGATFTVVVYLLAQALWAQRASGFTPLGLAYAPPTIGAHQRVQDHFVGMIPADAIVSTQDQLDPHLSSRHYLYLFEDIGAPTLPGAPPAEYVLLDASAPTYPLPSYQLYDRARALLRHGWHVRAAEDGLILLERGSGNSTIPAPFYHFADANRPSISYRIDKRAGDLTVLGFERTRTDLPNHPVPNLQYTFYLRPKGTVKQNLEPVVYETVGDKLVTCAHFPLGLAWLPTSHWRPGHTYLVRMEPLESTWNDPGTAVLHAEIIPVPGEPQPSCQQLWRHHGVLWNVGSLDIGS